MPADPRRSYYRILMVDPSADSEIISLVYRRLAQRVHPDVDPSPQAAERMKELNDAYATLSDRERRRAYDAELATRRDRRSSDRYIRRPGEVPFGTAGLPPMPADGTTVLEFGRYSGWTLEQVRRHDPDFIEWLMHAPQGRQYRNEITELLRRRS